jgi:hypothetical protein
MEKNKTKKELGQDIRCIRAATEPDLGLEARGFPDGVVICSRARPNRNDRERRKT